MSGTERSEDVVAGVDEQAAVRGIFTAPDGGRWMIEHERCVLQKFDGEVSEMTEEEAVAALAEVIVLEDGVVVDRWLKGDPRDAPR